MLRLSLLDVRERAGQLAQEIEIDLPEFTIHDISHLDALWPLADEIAPELRLTPTEAYLYGVGVLLHDLGLAIAAYPGGRDSLRVDPQWRDQLAMALRRHLGRGPSREEIDGADDEIRTQAERAILRARHAERAATLGNTSWDVDGDQRYLIGDEGLRATMGHFAGRIAASHWRSPSELPDLLPDQIGAPAGMPSQWTIRPLLLACLLRLADAAHLDAGRAPPARRAGRALSKESAAHWDFQARMLQATRREDRLIFASSTPFPASEASAWWLCRDVLEVVDSELRAVDALLADRDLERFAARSVQGIEDPVRLSELVETESWTPVDAHVGVSDVARLASRIGGHQLYGFQLAVPLRELIQNASDAVRARRELQESYRGQITVRVGEEDGRGFVEVVDDGLGMAREVLTGVLLDFGRSLWESSEVAAVHPGLAGSGFEPTGHFGIGFFSVFLWADAVDVISRPFRGGEIDTQVLSFGEGLAARPLLRPAESSERLAEGGTRVRLWLKPQAERELEPVRVQATLLAQLCGHLAPALSVDLVVADARGDIEVAVRVDDWLTIPGEELLTRTADLPRGEVIPPDAEEAKAFGSLLRIVRDEQGNPLGRMALRGGRFQINRNPFLGALVDGGLRVTRHAQIAGVLCAGKTNTARDRAESLVRFAELGAWASEQAELFAEIETSADGQPEHATAVIALGGTPGPLIVCRTDQGPMNLAALEDWAVQHNEIWLTDVTTEIERIGENDGLPLDHKVELEPAVVDYADWFRAPDVLEIVSDPPEELPSNRRLVWFLERAVAKAWGVDLDDLIREEWFGDIVVGYVNDYPLETWVVALKRPES
jgi:hypothetical protein